LKDDEMECHWVDSLEYKMEEPLENDWVDMMVVGMAAD
jgi:hypothetical protein